MIAIIELGAAELRCVVKIQIREVNHRRVNGGYSFPVKSPNHVGVVRSQIEPLSDLVIDVVAGRSGVEQRVVGNLAEPHARPADLDFDNRTVSRK